MLGKRLRLAAAGLTDVGRRRERNQDNTTHRVPTDEAELAKKGALFVICDGMGGHAAGEVAAEIGVNTIRDAYFASTSTDIIDSLADAIRAANEAIFEYAAEHPELTGMGTTCVTLLIHGGRAYFVNIGDSRGYLARDGKLRQVTLDHSWVAEQVRAGVLTEDQARVHAHRNVITRSLGTQPIVNADLFIEKLREGDRILLCSDGLHGYVDEQAVEKTVLESSQPDESVQALVDMANDNGGPDNITAVLVQLLEVPAITDTLSLPDATTSPDGAITQPLPIYSSPRMPAVKRTSSASEPALASVRPSKPVVKARAPRSSGRRVALNVARVLVVAAVIVLGFGIWDFTNGPYAASRAATEHAQNDISSARQTIAAAQSQDPAQALAALAQTQQVLAADLHDSTLDASNIASIQTVLTTELTPAVQKTLERYNTTNSIDLVSATGMLTYAVTCIPAGATDGTPAPLSNVTGFTSVEAPAGKPGAAPPTTQTLFALSGGALYQISAALDGNGAPSSNGESCYPIALPGTTGVLSVAADGATLYALVSLVSGATQVVAVLPNGANADGSPKVKTTLLVNVPVSAGQTPSALAVSGATAYVAFSGTGGPGVWALVKGAKSAAPVITLPQPAASLAATPTALYALLSDGTLGTAGADHTFATIATHAQPPASLEAPDSYAGATVPMPDASSSSVFGASATLAIDPALPTQALVGDPMHSRILRLTTGTSASATLADQYVYGRPVTHPGLFAISSNKTLLDVYLWNGSDLLAFSVAEPTA